MTTAVAAADARTIEVRDRIREARESRSPLRVRGAGTWMRAGRPTEGRRELTLADDRGIVEYVPGDLTITVRAGTPLSDITAATQSEGQWLPLDPWGGDAGTIGATISTATTGPHTYALGLPRDVVLGAEIVTGAEQIVRAGGRVVKNVAGFDLTRLMVGAWGTLGVITEVTLRLRARPAVVRTVAIRTRTSADALAALTAALRALPFTPLACEVLHARVASELKLGNESLTLLRVGGNQRAVDGQLDLLRSIDPPTDAPDDVWTRLRELAPDAAGVWRWSRLPSHFATTWQALEHGARDIDGVLMHGTPLRGVIRAIAPRGGDTSDADLARAASWLDGTVAIDVLPGGAWAHLQPRAAHDPISRAIRSTFDPDRILNRGILGGDA